MNYELTKGKKYNKIKIKGESEVSVIKVWTKDKEARAIHKEAKAHHNAQIKQLKSDIRKHKLLKQQAKLTYRLTK